MNTPLLIVAAVFALGAIGLLVARARMGARLDRLASALSLGPAEAASAAPGSLVHVAGEAAVGSGGSLTAPVSGQEVVWHRVLVTEQYERTERDSQGRTRTTTENRTVSDDSSTSPFVLSDEKGWVEILARGRQVRDAPLLADEREGGRTGLSVTVGGFRFGGGGRQRVQEWGLTTGTKVHAVGELTAGTDGTLRLDGNVDKRLVISPLDPATMTAKTGRTRLFVTIAAVVCAVVAVAAAVFALMVT